jgi:hypothetical protein
MDTDQQPAFHVHKVDGTGTTVFYKHASSLYLLAALAPQTNTNSPRVIAHSCLQTVARNKEGFTKRQIESADCTLCWADPANHVSYTHSETTTF